VWAYPGTAQIFWVPPIISETGKATDFKFDQYIHRVHPNKIPLKFLEKRERGRIQGLHIFSGTPIISGTGKATDFKFGEYIQRVHPNKSPLKILDKWERGPIQGLHNFFGYPLLSQEQVNLPRDTLWCIARSCDCMLSVRMSVTLVDHGHIGWKSWKLIARTISPTLSLFVAQTPSTYSQGNMGKFWGD